MRINNSFHPARGTAQTAQNPSSSSNRLAAQAVEFPNNFAPLSPSTSLGQQIQLLLLSLIKNLIEQLCAKLQVPNQPSPKTPVPPNTNPQAWDTARGDLMLFGDPTNSRIVPMKLSSFERLPDIPIDGKKVYSADHVTDDKSYVFNRESNYITVLERNPDTKAFETTADKIDLPFHPRTGAKNTQLGLNLVTGVDKPMFALIDYTKDELVAAGGRNQVTEGSINNYDGENATGHGDWVSDNQFVLLDRENNTLSLYGVNKVKDSWEVELQDTLTAPSSIHDISGNKATGIFYAALEGNPAAGIPAGVGELQLNGKNLELTRTTLFPGELSQQGAHHLDLHPNGQEIYIGDNSGKLYVINRENMEITATVAVGKGAGHTTFIPDKNIAVVTNHWDKFVSVIDMTTHQLIKNIEVAKDIPEQSAFLQAHTARVSPDKQYYYNFASDSGTFFRINLDELKLEGELYVGGTPRQASQPGELTLGYTGGLSGA